MKYCTVGVYRGKALGMGGCVISESEGVETAEKKLSMVPTSSVSTKTIRVIVT